MVYKNLDSSIVKGPYQEVRKGQEQQQQPQTSKEPAKKPMNEKYGAWGSVYKNKQNFINMHCG